MQEQGVPVTVDRAVGEDEWRVYRNGRPAGPAHRIDGKVRRQIMAEVARYEQGD